MTTIDGDLRATTNRFFAGPEPHPGAVRSTSLMLSRYFKMGAVDSVAGLVTWINLTGDNSGRPAAVGTFGSTRELAKWTV